MKNKLTIAGVLLLTYLGFLIATLPTSVVLNQVTLPKSIALSGVSGTVWHSQINQAVIGDTRIEKIHARLSFWSLFSLSPTLAITFGDSFIAGPEGALDLALSTETATINDLTLFIKANEIAQQLTLPLPITAKGDVALTLSSAQIDLTKNNQCIAAQGNVDWDKAGMIALEQNISIGKLSAELGCENGALALIISPNNNLGLTFSAYVHGGGKINGNGYLKPGANFPKALNDALPFLGKKDNRGRYRLKF